MNYAWVLYRRLAQAFPHEFRMAFGDDMLMAGEDAMRQLARRHGAAGLVRLLADAALRLPIEYMNEMRRDLRFAARSLVKSPGFTAVGVISMGLGIGLTTNIYSSNWALLARRLPGVKNAARLAVPDKPVSYAYIEQYREQKDLLDGVAAVESGVQFNLALAAEKNAKTERVYGQLVSPDYFAVLGVEAEHGRMLSAEIDKPGSAPAVVVSDAFWRNRMNAAPDAIGQTIRLNGQAATIVGVAPRRFGGALSTYPMEIFVPTTVPAAMAPELAGDVLHDRSARQFQALMCLRKGVQLETAEAALDGVTRRLDKLDSLAPPPGDKAKRVTLLDAGGRVQIPRTMRPVVLGFFSALMGIVIAIACLNLGTMVLARGAGRRRELAIRLSIGASRFRLIRQLLSEGVLLSLMGAVAGLGLAAGVWSLYRHLPVLPGAPANPDLALDWHAALFAMVLAVACGVGFSLLPAIQATRTDLAPALKQGTNLQLPGYRRFGVRNLAMAAQVAGSLTLLLVTGFLTLGILRGTTVPTKFDKRTMVFVSVDPVRDGYTAEKSVAFFQRLAERLKSAGGLQSFAMAAQVPFFGTDDDDFALTVDDASLKSPVQRSVVKATVGAGYFAALNEPALAGREFEERDERGAGGKGEAGSKGATLPIVLNAKAAHALFGNGNAVGQRLRGDHRNYEVVGVVADMKSADGMTEPIVYLPLMESDFARPPAGGVVVLARAAAAEDALGALRAAIAAEDPNLTVFNVQTLSEYLEQSAAQTRHSLITFGGVGLFGLVLTAIGLAGVTAYSVAQRRKEIGIRMALGATKGQALRLVLREGATLAMVGTAAGFLGAVVVARLLSTLTSAFADAFAVGVDDPRLLLGAPLLLASLALIACYLPARRAAQIDPMKTLRQE